MQKHIKIEQLENIQTKHPTIELVEFINWKESFLCNQLKEMNNKSINEAKEKWKIKL